MLSVLNTFFIHIDACWEDKHYIHPEKVYFEKRQSLPKYKYYLDMVFVEALKIPWQFFATQHVNEETLARIERDVLLAKEAAAAMKTYLSNLQKVGLAVREGTEVIAREGYTVNTNDLQELQRMQSQDLYDRTGRGGERAGVVTRGFILF